MPNNKSDKKNNRRNLGNFTEEAVSLKADKAREYPPSLNGIDKNES